MEQAYTKRTPFECIDCGGVVEILSEKDLEQKHIEELRARMLCTTCLKKRLEAKK